MPKVVFAHVIIRFSRDTAQFLNVLFLAGGQQIPIQQDPNDPTKWQVVSTTSQNNGMQMGSLSPTSEMDSPPGGKRLRRVACTCPNCRDNDGKGV